MIPRPGSPFSHSSILMTSAPISASVAVATGPCCQIVQSMIRIPLSGASMTFSYNTLGRDGLVLMTSSLSRFEGSTAIVVWAGIADQNLGLDHRFRPEMSDFLQSFVLPVGGKGLFVRKRHDMKLFEQFRTRRHWNDD